MPAETFKVHIGSHSIATMSYCLEVTSAASLAPMDRLADSVQITAGGPNLLDPALSPVRHIMYWGCSTDTGPLRGYSVAYPYPMRIKDKESESLCVINV